MLKAGRHEYEVELPMNLVSKPKVRSKILKLKAGEPRISGQRAEKCYAREAKNF
jgi:hypothetical protein